MTLLWKGDPVGPIAHGMAALYMIQHVNDEFILTGHRHTDGHPLAYLGVFGKSFPAMDEAKAYAETCEPKYVEPPDDDF